MASGKRGSAATGGNRPLGGQVMTLADALDKPQGVRIVTDEGDADPTADPGNLDNDALASDADNALIQAEELIDQLRGDSYQPGSAKVQFWRVRKGEREAFLFERDLADWPSYNFDYVVNNYGGGDYHIRVYQTGHRGARVNRIITLEAPREGSPAAVVQAEAVASSPASATETLKAILASIEASNIRMIETIKATVQASVPRSTKEILEEMVMMKNLLGLDGKPVAPPVTPDPVASLDKTLELIERLKDAASPDEGSGGFLKVVREAAPLIRDALNLRASQPAALPALNPAAAAAVQPAPVLVAPNPGASAAVSANESPEDEMKFLIKAYLDVLCSAAEANKPVAGYVETILDQAPEDFAEMLDDEQWFSKLSEVNERVKLFPKWFNDLYAAIDAELTKRDADGKSDNTKTG